MSNEMKPTKVYYDVLKDRINQDDWYLMPDGTEGKAQLGNFIKMMILYDSDLDDGILEYFGTNFSLLYRMLKDIDWSRCIITASGTKKTELCKKLNIDKGAYENHIRNYMKLNLMIRVGKGEYMLNPMKIYVGESSDQRLRMMEYESYRLDAIVKAKEGKESNDAV